MRIKPYQQIDLPLSNIGDVLLALPAARYVMKNHIFGLEDSCLFSNYHEFLQCTDIVDLCTLVTVRGKVAFPTFRFKPDMLRKGYRVGHKHKALEAFWFIGMDDVPVEELNYVRYRKDSLAPSISDKKFAVVCATFSDRRRKFTDEAMAELLEYLKASGYVPVLVGVTRRTWQEKVRFGEYNVDYSGCVNMVNKTRPDSLMQMLDEATVVISPDNGILHLAGCTDTPMVGYYTIIDHKYVAPIRGNEIGKDCINVEADIMCMGCYPRTDMFYKCAGTENPYEDDPVVGHELEGDADCVKALSKGQLIEAVKEVI